MKPRRGSLSSSCCLPHADRGSGNTLGKFVSKSTSILSILCIGKTRARHSLCSPGHCTPLLQVAWLLLPAPHTAEARGVDATLSTGGSPVHTLTATTEVSERGDGTRPVVLANTLLSVLPQRHYCKAPVPLRRRCHVTLSAATPSTPLHDANHTTPHHAPRPTPRCGPPFAQATVLHNHSSNSITCCFSHNRFALDTMISALANSFLRSLSAASP